HPPRQYPPAIHVGIHQSRSRNSEPNPIRRPKTAEFEFEFEFEFDPDTEHRIPNTEYRIPKPLSTLELGADDPRAGDQRLQFGEGGPARRLAEAAVRQEVQLFRRDALQAEADPFRNVLGCLDVVVLDVHDAGRQLFVARELLPEVDL